MSDADDLPDGVSPEEAGEAFANGDDPTSMEDTEADETAAQDPETDADVETLSESIQVMNQQLNGIRVNLQQQNSILREYIEAARGVQAMKEEEREPTATDTSVESDHDYDEDALEEQAYEWIGKAAGFYDDLFDDVVEVEFAEVDGTPGLKIESGKPWNTECHDGNDWKDKDRWDAHHDAFKKVTSGEESIEYHGKPDFFNFLPAADAPEVFD